MAVMNIEYTFILMSYL